MIHDSSSILNPQSLIILGTPVHVVTMADTLAITRQFMTEPRLHQICTTNPEFVMAAQTDDDFRRALHEADLCLADGIGLVVASRWVSQRELGQRPLPQRIPGSELVYHLTEMCAQEGWRLYLLGAAPGIAEQAAAIFQEKYPKLIIAGTYAGSPDPVENDGIIQRINDGRADILFVAYGAPNQDKWIARNRDALPTVRVAIGVGGSLDFVTGKAIRAPRWVQKLGLEWLHRLIKEPWRWRRMLALPRFALTVVIRRQGERASR